MVNIPIPNSKFSRFLFCLTLASFVLSFAPSLIAQEWLNPSPEEAAAHLLKHTDPVYPEFAISAGIEGVVRIQVGIYKDGLIHSIGVESGPPSLRKAATDAVLHYVYKPFEKNGVAVNASTTVDVVFHLPKALEKGGNFPVPNLSRDNFVWVADRSLNTDVSVALRNWLASDFKKRDECSRDCTESSSSDGTARDPITGLPTGTLIVAVSTMKPTARLYVVGLTKSDCCGATGNCPIELVEEAAGSFRRIALTMGTGFYVHSHSGSLYPDIFVGSHSSAIEMGVEGYSNVGGKWGQLYCGGITVDEDQHEKSNVHVCK